jgi:hypothetical protein
MKFQQYGFTPLLFAPAITFDHCNAKTTQTTAKAF